MIHRHGTFVPITTSLNPATEVFTFTPANLETDGYQWYSSNIVDTDGKPIIELGLMETIVDTTTSTLAVGSASLTRNIWLKFKGRVAWGSLYYNFWSGKSADGFGYDNPDAYIIAQLPSGSDECFVFDSVDLGQVCGENCNVELEVDGVLKTAPFLLQREELCPWRAEGYGDPANYGRLTSDACVDNPCQVLADPISVFFSTATDSFCGGNLGILPPCTSLTRNNLTFTVESYFPAHGDGYILTNGETVIEVLNKKVDGVLTGDVQISMTHGTRQAIDEFVGGNVDMGYGTICGDSNVYEFGNGSTITFSMNQ
jgi:hypothetical protein